jgi:hypothetical protein
VFSCCHRAGPSFWLPRHAKGWKVEAELELDSSHLRLYRSRQKTLFWYFPTNLAQVLSLPITTSPNPQQLTLRLLKPYIYIYIYIYIYMYDISSLRVIDLTLILLTWRKSWSNNASK